MRQLRRLGLTFAAFLALGAFASASAWATSPPEYAAGAVLGGGGRVGLEASVVNHGLWRNSPTSYAYQWERCNASGGECVDIPAATNQFYFLEGIDAGHTVRAEIIASNSAGSGTAHTSKSSVVTAGTAPEFVPENHSYPLGFSFSGPAGFETPADNVPCEGFSGSGTISGPNQIVGVHMTLTNCHVAGFFCLTAESSELHGHLGYINKASKEIGLDLVPAAGNTFFPDFQCDGSVRAFSGAGLIARIGPVNTTTRSFEMTYSEERGAQRPDVFEGREGEVQLKWHPPLGVEAWGLSSTSRLTTGRAAEIVG